MQVAKIAVIAAVLLGFGAAAGAQSRDENRSRCKDSNADLSIGGCTALIQSGAESRTNLAIIFNNRGNAYSNRGQYDRAIEDYDQAIGLKPDRAVAFYSRGLAYLGKGQCYRAIQDYDQAIRLKPDYVEAFNNRGLAYDDAGQYNRAIQDYDQAIRLRPDYANAFNNRGLAYRRKGQYDRAIQDYDQAISLRPDYPEAFNNRGVAYSGKGQYDRAIEDYDQAISLKPDCGYAFGNRGRAKFYLAHFLDAAGDFQNALSLNSPDVPMLWLHLARKNAGQDDAQGFTQQAGQIDSSKWPAPLVNLFPGRLTPEQTLAAASNPDSIKERDQRCEAEFYIGEYLLLREERSNALVHFRTARDTCPHNFLQYDGAAAEMKRLGAETKPGDK